MVARYLSYDTSADGVLFAVYTSQPINGDHKPHTATISPHSPAPSPSEDSPMLS
jgi:hypothetical protein